MHRAWRIWLVFASLADARTLQFSMKPSSLD
jgi:hypothetical protein